MKKEIKITYDDTIFENLSSLKLNQFLSFCNQLTSVDADLEIDLDNYGADSVLLTATSYQDDVYQSWLIFDNNNDSK